MKPYPTSIPSELGGMHTALTFISRERQNDITDWNNLPNIYMRGRKVGKVPSASTDVAVTDRAGDFNFDASFIYIYTGTAWRRVALATW